MVCTVSDIVVETRTPVIDSESSQRYPADEMDRQWRLVTEAVRRKFTDDPGMRMVLIGFCKEPVVEDLSERFLQAVSIDGLVARLVDRYRSGVKAYLELPAVLEDQIIPDVRSAVSLPRPRDFTDTLAKLRGEDYGRYREIFENRARAGVFLRGITEEERAMVIRRYGYARDVKLLALGAEIADCGGVTLNENGEAFLPSGIKMVVDLNVNNQGADLFNPCLWERRRQLQDRVYEVNVGGKKYILKEKKTVRHARTMQGGHKEGRLSSEEFEIAKDLHENGGAVRGEIEVSWEHPIGYVLYPDGFSFVIFDYEEDLIEGKSINLKLAQRILDFKDQFLEEYRSVVGLVSGLSKGSLEISFEDFSRAKALRMESKARAFMQEIMIEKGYTNRDFNNYLYRIKDGGRPRLEIAGFDFEYFSKLPLEQIPERLERQRRIQREFGSVGIGSDYWEDGSRVTREQEVAYLALLENEKVSDGEALSS